MHTLLTSYIVDWLGTLGLEGELPTVRVERPTDEKFGDYTTNVAMLLAKPLRKSPLQIAESLVTHLSSQRGISTATAVAPGYVNIILHTEVYSEFLHQVLALGGEYGNEKPEKPLTINNEFVSANPTGPMHLGNGCSGYFGDSLTRVLRKLGHQVTSEYYVNDAGEQVLKLGHSILGDAEAVYGGDYIETLRTRMAEVFPTPGSVREVGQWGAEIILSEYIQPVLKDKMGVTFDTYTSERVDVVESGLLDRALATLTSLGHTYEQDGALWLRTTNWGDDKDRVLRKSDGELTYFATDCGHILGYIESGVERIIETWGADHHGYMARFTAAARALGYTGDLKFNLVQLIKIVRDGQEVRMSKRAGNVVTIEEVIDTVGPEVTRFMMLMRSLDSALTFDLAVAEEHSEKNPVYYVQYAHARMAGILRKAAEAGIAFDPAANFTMADLHVKERLLLREIMEFPVILHQVSDEYSVHHLTAYARQMADAFHSFYAQCRVLGDDVAPEDTTKRLALVYATQVVLAEVLRLVGVSAPKEM
jgi:arginyl-tRNA synthetase